jgi:signal transduction histidine kinase
MKVGTRLYLAVVPAVLGVLLVAALAYWGERGRQAPALLVLIAVVASVTSLVVAWRNTHYVAQRVLQLAQSRHAHTRDASPTSVLTMPNDELDEIERTVHGLTGEVAAERLAGERRTKAAESRAAEYAELLEGAVATMGARLEEAQLPLHILLSSPFGELNENQEEMLGAAHQAVEAADRLLQQLNKLIAIDRGAVHLVPTRVMVGELLRAPLAIAKSRATASAVRLTADIPGSLPRVIADPVHTQAALTALLCDVVARADEGSEVSVTVRDEEDGAHVLLTLAPSAPGLHEPLDVRLAKRVLERGGGYVTDAKGTLAVRLRVESMGVLIAPDG